MKPREITKLRKILKLNFLQFGKLIGVTAESVSNWEKGKFKPSPCWVDKMNALKDEAQLGKR